jgi:B-cell receptor-associated protein 31
MSVQWTFAISVVSMEMFFISILLLPFVSSRRWRTVFRSSIVSRGTALMSTYFPVMILVLLVLFGDALRNAHNSWKLSNSDPAGTFKPAEHNRIMKNWYKATRNLLLSGLSLFLCWVLRRLIDIISEKAVLEVDNAVSMMQVAGSEQDDESNNENRIRIMDASIISLQDELIQTKDALETALEKLKKYESESGDSNDADADGFSIIKRSK